LFRVKMSHATPVFRFAPSPNGRLHLGHAYSALLNERLAHDAGGKLLLRIENTDLTRARPEHEAAIREDLAWLGIRFDGEVRRQSEHFSFYGRHRDRLRALGVLYPCTCTRGQIAVDAGEAGGRDPDGAPLYMGRCRARSASERAALLAGAAPVAERLDMAAALTCAPGELSFTRLKNDRQGQHVADPARWGDAVVVRKGTSTSYHLSCVADDAVQGVTHVVRGADMEAATDLHILLQRLLGLPTPIYRFHRLVLDDDGRKLAKSRGSRTLADLRADGITADEIRRGLGFPTVRS
jgi:glutamyl-Q tRNA(Asp) synthetase